MWAAALLVVVGCGRFDFDDRLDGGEFGDGSHLDAVAPACASWSMWSAPQRIVAFSSSDNDWEPALSGDAQRLVYTFQNLTTEDLELATWLGSSWSAPMPITALNVGGAVGPAWNAAGTRLYFGSERGGSGKQLYVSSYTGGVFGAPALVAGLENVANATAPTLSGDELEMFYTRDFGTGSADIGRATRGAITEAWNDRGVVAELAPSAETGWASLSGDGLSIYIENDLLPTQSIEVATRPAIGAPFGMPVVVPELNTVGDNGDPEISRDGTTMYFSSDRPGGAGMTDIWTASRTCL